MAAGQESIIRQMDKARSKMMGWLPIEEELSLISAGMAAIHSRVGINSDARLALYELQTIGTKILEAKNQGSPYQLEDFYQADHIQGWLNLSENAFRAIYSVACNLFKNNELDDAIGLYTLLTELNQFQFEPWLLLGLCHEMKKNFFPAVCIFAMSSLIDLKHPLPHLHAAGIYLQAGKQNLAQETLELCLENITPEGKMEYQGMISDLKREIYFKKWAHDLLAPPSATLESRSFMLSKF